jgi:hypothetical protein
MGALIQINGVATQKKVVSFGAAVSLTNGAAVGTSQVWTVTDYPKTDEDVSPDFGANWTGWVANGDGTYSITQLSGGFNPVAFAPDITGTYLFKLTSIEGGKAISSTAVVQVPDVYTGETDPAAGEKAEQDPRVGWKQAVNRKLRKMARLLPGCIRICNQSGGTIPRGTVVRISGSVDAHTVTPNAVPSGSTVKPEYIPTVALGNNGLAHANLYHHGITEESIPNNGFGFVRIEGVFEGRTDISYAGYAAGGRVYFGAAGVQTATPGVPAAAIGLVLNSGSAGRVLVTGVSSVTADVIDVTKFGADPTGVANSTLAVRAAIAAALNARGSVWFPPGNYLIDDELLVQNHGVHIRGSGRVQTFITFDPVVAKSCFRFQNSIAAVLSLCSISGITFQSSNTAVKRIAIEAVDVSQFDVYDVSISPWFGAKSEGLKTAGRELISVRRFQASCPLPIHIAVNPNNGTDCLDHTHFEDLYLVGTDLSEYLITVDPLVVTGPVSWDGGQAWVGGGGGLLWEDSNAGSPSDKWIISNVRYEQTVAAGGWAIRINKTGAGSSVAVLIQNFFAGNFTDYNGIYLRNAPHVLINSGFQGTFPTYAIDFNGSSAGTHIESTMRLVDPQPRAELNQNGSTGAIEIWAVPKGNGPDPRIAVYDTEARDPEQRSINIVGNQVSYATALPTTFQHLRGAIVWNSAPSEGGPIGWVCIGSGTPGAFAPIANVLAEGNLDTVGTTTLADVAAFLTLGNSYTELELALSARRTGGARGTGAVGDVARWVYRLGVQMNGPAVGPPTVLWATIMDSDYSSTDLIAAGVSVQDPPGGAAGYVLVKGSVTANDINLRWHSHWRVLTQNR